MLKPEKPKAGSPTEVMQALLKKIAPVPPRIPLQVSVTTDESFNAVAYPGGYIQFHKGAYDKLETEQQKAMILAHEIAHSELGHSAKRLSQHHSRDYLEFFRAHLPRYIQKPYQ